MQVSTRRGGRHFAGRGVAGWWKVAFAIVLTAAMVLQSSNIQAIAGELLDPVGAGQVAGGEVEQQVADESVAEGLTEADGADETDAATEADAATETDATVETDGEQTVAGDVTEGDDVVADGTAAEGEPSEDVAAEPVDETVTEESTTPETQAETIASESASANGVEGRTISGSKSVPAGQSIALTTDENNGGDFWHGEYEHRWTVADSSIATIENGDRFGCTVNGVSAGTTTVTHEWGYYEYEGWWPFGEYVWRRVGSETYTVTVTSPVPEGSYPVYIYTLVPGVEIDDNRSNDEKWNGMGVGFISDGAVKAPAEYGDEYKFDSIPDEVNYANLNFPEIKVNGRVYTYAAPGSANEYKEGYYRIEWIRMVTAGGANTGANRYNPVVDSDIITFHLDGRILPNETDQFNVSFYVQEAGSDEFVLQEEYVRFLPKGTLESKLDKPSPSNEFILPNGAKYTLDAWYTDEDCTQSTDFSGTLQQDMKYYARYVPAASQTYTVTYEAGTGGDVSPISQQDQVLECDDITGSTATPQEGYKFEGWYKVNADGTETRIEGATNTLGADLVRNNLNGADGVYSDTTFKAKFVADEAKNYDVFYTTDGNGTADPTVNEDVQVLGTDKVTGSTATANDGYKFEGWYKVGADGEETRIEEAGAELTAEVAKKYVNASEGIYSDTTFKAKFVADETRTYKVTYVAGNGGKIVDGAAEENTEQVLSTDGVTGSKAEADTGYRFIGWYVKGTNVLASEDVDLTADEARARLNKSGSLYADTDFEARFVVDSGQTKTLRATVDYALGGVVQVDEHVDLKDTVQVLEPDTLSTAGVTAKEFAGWTLDRITINGEEVEPLPATVNNDDEIVYHYVADTTALSVSNYSGVYDGESHGIAVNGLLEGDAVSYSVSNSFTDVTGSPVSVTATVTRNGVAIWNGTATVSIMPATIRVTISDATKVEGQVDPGLESTYVVPVAGELAGFEGSIAREPGEEPGTYVIDRGTLVLVDRTAQLAGEKDFKASNYTLEVVPGTFTITAAPGGGDNPGGGTDTPDNPGGGGGTDNPGGGTGTNPGGGAGGTNPGTGTGAGTNPAPTPVTATADDDAAADDEAIDDDENPLADDASADDESDDAESIDDDSNPLASGTGSTAETCWVHWAVIVGIIVTVAYFAVCAARTRRATDELASFEDDVLDRR